MALQKIQAGREIDAVTHHELKDALGEHLRSWVAEVATGGRFVRYAVQGAAVAGALDIGGHVGESFLGPAPGFVWDVRRLRITGLGAADVVNVYVNDTGPTALVCSTVDLGEVPTNRLFLFDRQLVLYPGDTLKVTGTVAATGPVTISGQALELPIGLAWKLS